MAGTEFDFTEKFSVLGAVGLGDRRLMALLFPALQLGEASKVAPVVKLSVVFVALFGVTFLRKSFPR